MRYITGLFRSGGWAWSMLALMVLMLSSGSGGAWAQVRGERVIVSSESDDPAAVAAAWSRVNFPCAPNSRLCPYTAVLATSEQSADALAAPLVLGRESASRPLEGATAPLLITDPERLSAPARAELERLKTVLSVVILGGPDAVSSQVDRELFSLGLNPRRTMGATRIETAVAIAEGFEPEPGADGSLGGEVVVSRAYGDGDETAVYADAVSAGAYNGFAGVPLLLTESEELSPPVEEYLREHASELARVSVIGGVDAVSDEVVEAIRGVGIPVVQRVGGADRTATAAAVVELLWRGPEDSQEFEFREFVLEDAYAPGVWASGLAAGGRGPLVFATGSELPETTRSLLEDADDGTSLRCGPLVAIEACDSAAEVMGLEVGRQGQEVGRQGQASAP